MSKNVEVKNIFKGRYLSKRILSYLSNKVKNNFHIKEDRNHYVYKIVEMIKDRLNILGNKFYEKNIGSSKRYIFFKN